MTEEVWGSGIQRRELAIKRIRAKYGFKVHLVVLLAVNAMLILFSAVMLASGLAQYAAVVPYPGVVVPPTFFWPIFPMAGWGIGVAIHGYSVYRGNVYTEEQIQCEMKALA